MNITTDEWMNASHGTDINLDTATERYVESRDPTKTNMITR